jgi:hypothetical protein
MALIPNKNFELSDLHILDKKLSDRMHDISPINQKTQTEKKPDFTLDSFQGKLKPGREMD